MRGRQREYVSAGRAEQGVVGGVGGAVTFGGCAIPLWNRTCKKWTNRNTTWVTSESGDFEFTSILSLVLVTDRGLQVPELS